MFFFFRRQFFVKFTIKLQSKSQIVKKMLKNFVEILQKGVKLIG